MKRLSLFSLIAVLTLALMGFGFAKWSDTVTISVAAESGEVSWGFVSGSAFHQDNGSDVNADPGLINVGSGVIFFNPEGKDVGSTTADLSDTNEDGVLDKLTITVHNAYPGYYNEISAKVQNFGTIPVIIGKAQLEWMGNTHEILTGVNYILCENGAVVAYGSGTVPADGVIELCWMDNDGKQQHPGEKLEESFELLVLQPAEQNAEYTFSISLEAVQWNEIK